ncbi:MAG: hypothetical protein GY847_30830 [Proteobacteria bacterium]|nr:hypothetical protein [Pseudomonadota bacterium]
MDNFAALLLLAPNVAVSALFSRVSCEHAKEAADIVTAMKTVGRSLPNRTSESFKNTSISKGVSVEFPLAIVDADVADSSRPDGEALHEQAAVGAGQKSADRSRRQSRRDSDHEHAQCASRTSNLLR